MWEDEKMCVEQGQMFDVIWRGTAEEFRQMLAQFCSSLIDLDISTSLRSLVEIVLQKLCSEIEHDILIDLCYVKIETYLTKQNKVYLRMVTLNTHISF